MVKYIIKKGDKSMNAVSYTHLPVQLPNLAAPVMPVVKGQVDVEQHELRTAPQELRRHILKILCDTGFHPPGLQVLLYGAGNGPVVFYNQYGIHAFAPFSPAIACPLGLRSKPRLPARMRIGPLKKREIPLKRGILMFIYSAA